MFKDIFIREVSKNVFFNIFTDVKSKNNTLFNDNNKKDIRINLLEIKDIINDEFVKNSIDELLSELED